MAPPFPISPYPSLCFLTQRVQPLSCLSFSCNSRLRVFLKVYNKPQLCFALVTGLLCGSFYSPPLSSLCQQHTIQWGRCHAGIQLFRVSARHSNRRAQQLQKFNFCLIRIFTSFGFFFFFFWSFFSVFFFPSNSRGSACTRKKKEKNNADATFHSFV